MQSLIVGHGFCAERDSRALVVTLWSKFDLFAEGFTSANRYLTTSSIVTNVVNLLRVLQFMFDAINLSL